MVRESLGLADWRPLIPISRGLPASFATMSVSLRTRRRRTTAPDEFRDQQHCTHSCRGRCQALQSSSSARRERRAGHSISFPACLDTIARESDRQRQDRSLVLRRGSYRPEEQDHPPGGRSSASARSLLVISAPPPPTSSVPSPASRNQNVHAILALLDPEPRERRGLLDCMTGDGTNLVRIFAVGRHSHLAVAVDKPSRLSRLGRLTRPSFIACLFSNGLRSLHLHRR